MGRKQCIASVITCDSDDDSDNNINNIDDNNNNKRKQEESRSNRIPCSESDTGKHEPRGSSPSI